MKRTLVYKTIAKYNHVWAMSGIAQAEEFLLEYKQNNIDIILGTVWENYLYRCLDTIKEFVSHVRKNRPNSRIFLIANSADRRWSYEVAKIALDDVLFIDYFLYRVYREVVVKQQSKQRQIFGNQINSNKKFLFLQGKPNKINRIGLFKKIVDTNLIDRCIWSLFYLEHEENANKQAHEFVPELSESDFFDFLKKWQNSPDNIRPVESYRLEGIPYDVSLYTNTDFSLISETMFCANEEPWITEKTWIPILNQHPFIIAGDTGTLGKLNKMGFETFEDLLPVSDYDLIADSEQRLDAIVKNTMHFLENNLIQECISKSKHNLANMEHLYNLNLQSIYEFKAKNGLQADSVDEIVPTESNVIPHQNNVTYENELFKTFYNNVKDPTWPECENENDFYNLPEIIQRECIDVFGYVPKKIKGNK